MASVDLNCDMGETPGNQPGSKDDELLKYVSSANVACGFHAGDPHRMQLTVTRAIQRGVAIGAHPGLPDRKGFGRLERPISAKEVYQLTLYQIGALYGFVRAAGGTLRHVKAHGALYNMAARDEGLAKALAAAVYDFDANLILYALAGSEMVRAAKARGLQIATEGFVDRTYQTDGTLTPRSHPDALITDIETLSNQAVTLSKRVDTLCIHGDDPQAVEHARVVRDACARSGITIIPPFTP